MPELKDLVQYALDKQPAKFKETFGDLLSQRVVDRVEELKAEISANMFGEAPEDDEDDIDYDSDSDDDDLGDDDDDAFVDDIEISDEELDDLVNFDDEDDSYSEDDDMEEEVVFEDEDESFPEEGPAVKEGLRNFVKKVGAKIRQGMEDDLTRADDARASKVRDDANKAILKKHYGTSDPNKIYKMRAHSIKSGRGDF